MHNYFLELILMVTILTIDILTVDMLTVDISTINTSTNNTPHKNKKKAIAQNFDSMQWLKNFTYTAESIRHRGLSLPCLQRVCRPQLLRFHHRSNRK